MNSIVNQVARNGVDPPQDLFYPISGARAHEEVALQITYAIRSGAYPIGARLPNIKALSAAMMVSRPTVGQALKLLSNAGIVEVLRGIHGGIVVKRNAPPSQPLCEQGPTGYVGLMDILEARRALEVEIAVLAAKRGTPEHFAALRDNLKQFEQCRDASAEQRILYDHKFHYILGHMCQNHLLAIYQHQLLERIYFELSKHDFFERDEDVSSVLYWHKKTFDAIRKGDAEEIRKVIRRHFRPLEEYAEQLQKKSN